MKLSQTHKNILFTALTVILFFAISELILRVVGFHYSNTPLEMQFVRRNQIQYTIDGNALTNPVKFRKDPVQFWVPVQSFEQKLSLQKPEGVIRIAALGDSCTQGCAGEWGKSSYPGFLEGILNAQGSNAKVEVLNAGVGSYSSYQGLKRLERTVLKYHPDLLMVYFGWNDHWLAPQADREVKIFSDLEVFLFNLVEPFRFFQLLHFGLAKMMRKTLQDGVRNTASFRVPPDQYGENLNAIIDRAQSQGISVLMITAPYDLKDWRPSPELFPFPREVLEATQMQYNQIVRSIAAARGTFLLDLEMIVKQAPPGIFMSQDGIHFHPKGCALVGALLAKKISDEKILPVSIPA